MGEDINSYRNTLYKYVNKPLYVFGLSALQILGGFLITFLFLIIGIGFLESTFIGLGLAVVSGLGIYKYFQPVAKANMEGDPNFYLSRISYNGTKRVFVDSKKVIKNIVK